MDGPGDSSLIAKAITSSRGQRKRSAITEKEMSTILFKIKPLMRTARSRETLLPRPTAISNPSLRLISGKSELEPFAREGREDACAAEFVNSILLRRFPCSGNGLRRPRSCGWRQRGLTGMKFATSNS